ncbi:Flavin-containing monooxygenase FMO [Botryosphaeria dothidea]|uniref:Flavin-containing monooxygenase FMO n=1 Tax=Botryosphaeria dothidea TaxID=55169 RepID=A0A8H4NBA5_9PEZI|nr:Flavin-containing monooxygenase FMO [Botryosphaeria dothidea]
MSSANVVASNPIRFNARKVAVVGAGPCGLAALKYLSAEKKFDKLVAFEQRSSPGGLWNYTPEDRDDGSFAVPKTRPTKEDLDKPIWKNKAAPNGGPNGHSVNGEEKEAQFLSPVYERLETNIPKQLMQFHDFAFPEESQLFPTHWTVDRYLKDYAKEVEHLIQFQTQVVDVKLLESKETDGLLEEKWTVVTKNVVTGELTEEIYDAVVVANGHFYIPFIPEISGIKEWNKAHPGSITHSKFYRVPDSFKDKKVIVVGNSASGLDIGGQISTVCSLPLINSIKGESYMSRGPPPKFKKEVQPIKHLDASTRTATFEDGSTESDIDAIVFCTGYLYSLPFLSDLEPALVSDGTRVENTYQHVFYTPHPTLTFLVLNQRIIPFPTSEVQSAVVARTLAGRLTLPAAPQMRAWELHTLAVNGEGNDFHTLWFPQDADYINTLHDWALKAENEGSGVGKTPPRWSEWHYWCRERFPDIRKAFTERGEERKGVRELQEIGFDFEEWKKQKEAEAKELL